MESADQTARAEGSAGTTTFQDRNMVVLARPPRPCSLITAVFHWRRKNLRPHPHPCPTLYTLLLYGTTIIDETEAQPTGLFTFQSFSSISLTRVEGGGDFVNYTYVHAVYVCRYNTYILYVQFFYI